jgi:hypothetical protein
MCEGVNESCYQRRFVCLCLRRMRFLNVLPPLDGEGVASKFNRGTGPLCRLRAGLLLRLRLRTGLRLLLRLADLLLLRRMAGGPSRGAGARYVGFGGLFRLAAFASIILINPLLFSLLAASL